MADARRRAPRTMPDRGPAPAREPSAPAIREVTGPMFIDTARGEFKDLRPAEPVMSRRQFEAEYQRLLRAAVEAGENPGSFSCQDCRRCANCMFCVACDGCYHCTHSNRCRDSAHLTHCDDCESCNACAYCARCAHCTGSSYLVMCQSCSDCTYCFGCVGLSKKDFHILNVKYTKTEYFRIVKALRAELGLGPG